MKIYKALMDVRLRLNAIEEQMRTGVLPAERRLGMEAVRRSFLALSKAQDALQELDVVVRPPIEDGDRWPRPSGS